MDLLLKYAGETTFTGTAITIGGHPILGTTLIVLQAARFLWRWYIEYKKIKKEGNDKANEGKTH